MNDTEKQCNAIKMDFCQHAREYWDFCFIITQTRKRSGSFSHHELGLKKTDTVVSVWCSDLIQLK